MAVNPSPFGPKPQFELANGQPAVGNKLFFYVAGSVNTKQDTYTSSTGAVANTNPIVLNSLGQPTNEIWFTEGLAYKVVYAPSTDTDPPSSPIWTIDNLRGINDVTVSVDQWVAFGGTPTFIGATSFSLVGDQTTDFHSGRRLKTTNSGGTVYSTIVSSAFAAVTTITVVNDSGTLDSGLSAVSYGLLSATNPSTPLLADTYPIVSGSVDKTKKVRVEADGLTTATTRVWTARDADFQIGTATQAEMEAASAVNVSVTPGIVHFHPAIPKIVVVVTNTGVASPTVTTLYSALGTVSCSRASSGNYTVSWTTALSGTTNMAPVLTTGPTANQDQTLTYNTKTTTSVTVANRIANDGSQTDPAQFVVVIYGDMT